jgi:hypothetical protein
MGFFRSLGYLAVECGIDPRRFGNLLYLPKLWKDANTFRAQGGSIDNYWPFLDDYKQSAGSDRGHYFHQDLLVASLIHENNPKRHVDIGSRVDGFIAHVASYRTIEMLDIRPMPPSVHKNIVYVQADLMEPGVVNAVRADSVSCLHAIEHFGLGRYGDVIDPKGHITGFRNIWSMVEPGGRLYIAFPIGIETIVRFNAQRTFGRSEVFNWFDKKDYELERFDFVDDAGDLHTQKDVDAAISVQNGCGIYTFRKLEG